MPKYRPLPRSVPKGSRDLWRQTADQIFRLESLLEALEGKESKQVAERIIHVARDNCQAAIAANRKLMEETDE